jgi:hypothetical protein
MNEMIDIPHEPDLGYIFYPAADDGVFGSTRLDVVLHEHPTRRHYDPESIQVTIATSQESTNVLHFNYSTPSDRFRVCAHRILIVDRVGKRIEVFCFGGTLDILNHQQETICVFQSPAPILDLTSLHSVHMLFASEVEILIAERRAAWNPHHPHEFMRHLAQVEPTSLYIACLDTIAAKFAEYPHISDPVYHQFIHLLQQEIEAWRRNGRWPLIVPKLTDLL